MSTAQTQHPGMTHLAAHLALQPIIPGWPPLLADAMRNPVRAAAIRLVAHAARQAPDTGTNVRAAIEAPEPAKHRTPYPIPRRPLAAFDRKLAAAGDTQD